MLFERDHFVDSERSAFTLSFGRSRETLYSIVLFFPRSSCHPITHCSSRAMIQGSWCSLVSREFTLAKELWILQGFVFPKQ